MLTPARIVAFGALLVGIALTALVALGPWFGQAGTSEGRPTWRGSVGVPLVERMPKDLVAVLRIARGPTPKTAIFTMVLAPAKSCSHVELRIPGGPRYSSQRVQNAGCEEPVVTIVKARRRPPVAQVDGTTWTIAGDLAGEGGCRLGRQKLCVYWLLAGGRFAEPFPTRFKAVQVDDPEAEIATFDRSDLVPELTDGVYSGALETPDPDRAMRCAAAAAPACRGFDWALGRSGEAVVDEAGVDEAN